MLMRASLLPELTFYIPRNSLNRLRPVDGHVSVVIDSKTGPCTQLQLGRRRSMHSILGLDAIISTYMATSRYINALRWARL